VETALLTNQQPFDQEITQIEYREGYRAAAKRLSATLKGRMAMVRKHDLRSDIQLRLVLGKDVHNENLLFGSRDSQVRIASRGNGQIGR